MEVKVVNEKREVSPRCLGFTVNQSYIRPAPGTDHRKRASQQGQQPQQAQQLLRLVCLASAPHRSRSSAALTSCNCCSRVSKTQRLCQRQQRVKAQSRDIPAADVAAREHDKAREEVWHPNACSGRGHLVSERKDGPAHGFLHTIHRTCSHCRSGIVTVYPAGPRFIAA